MNLICDSEHIYRDLDTGEIYDGVTSILRAEGFMSDFIPDDLDWYLERGRKIHEATAMWDMDILDEEKFIPAPGEEDIRPYLESWKKYRYATEGTPLIVRSKEEVEFMLCDPIYKYAGTPDRLDVDLKSGVPARWHLFQLGAYCNLMRINKLGVGPHKAVYLQDNGSMPKVKIYTPSEIRRAGETVLCALNVNRAKQEARI